MSAQSVEMNELEVPGTPPTPESPKRDFVQEMIDGLADQVFSSELAEYPVKIKMGDSVLEYRLRELNGDQRSDYTSFQASKAKIGPDGKVIGIKDYKGFEIKALSMSLYGPDGKLVPEVIIGKLPAKLIKNLAAIVLRISGLDDKAEERAKNS